MTLDLTAFDPVLKSHYVDKRVAHLADLKSPAWATVKRNPKAGGKHIVQPVQYENPTGGNADIATAIANAGASSYEDFILTRKKHYQVAYIDNETIHASKGDRNAFLPALGEVDRAFKQAGRRGGQLMFRTRGGYIGRLQSGSTITGTTFTLDSAVDAYNLQVGMKIAFSDTDGTSGSLRDSGDTLTISGINRAAGTFTTTTAGTNIASLADTDYIFVEGDFGACMSGFPDWLPSTAPGGSDSFYGVNRSTDDRLYGVIRDANGEPLSESLQKHVADICMMGGEPDRAWMNPQTLSDLQLEMAGRGGYEMTRVSGRAGIGFPGFKVIAGGREVVCVADVNCPADKVYVLQSDTWTLHSAGSAPMFLQRDGLLQRSATADSYEVRVGMYLNLGCSAPCYNGVINL